MFFKLPKGLPRKRSGQAGSTMVSTGRRAWRRSQRYVCDHLIFVTKVIAAVTCLLFLLQLFPSPLHSVFRPTFYVHEATLNWDLVGLARFNSLSHRSALNHVSEDSYHRFRDDAVDVILQTSAASRSNSDERDWSKTDASSGSIRQITRSEVPLVSRVAFGSCTSRRAIDQPIWREGVIPSNPDAWIWAGDIAYMDWPDVNCKESPQHHQCNCTRNWLHNNRQTCLSGDIAHAKQKLEMQLVNPDYKEFLMYMCPNARSSPTSAWGDLALCNRPVLGTWDDHDYNWQDGDKRLPTKVQQKHLFLDAFGVPFDSPRRLEGRGMYWKQTLNEGIDGKEIDVLLLDERFHRDSKPCRTRREFCEKVNLPDPTRYKHDWCKDFLQGGEDDKGSCCRKDEQVWAGWCKSNKKPGDDLWEATCNPKSRSFGSADLAVDIASGGPIRKGSASSTTYNDGVLCEVLGPEQRSWLQTELYESKSPLKLVVSGSPSFNNPKDYVCSKALRRRPEVNCSCYDDYDCFRPAQINLLHNLAHAPGCVVVLTGDFHFSDIKALQPGKQTYSDAYESSDFPRPIFQVMASGLTVDTAPKASCDGYRVDKNGLRPEGQCSFVSGPAFGMIEVDWESNPKLVKLQIRDDKGAVKLENVLSLGTCTPL